MRHKFILSFNQYLSYGPFLGLYVESNILFNNDHISEKILNFILYCIETPLIRPIKLQIIIKKHNMYN